MSDTEDDPYKMVALNDLDDGPVELVTFVEAPEDLGPWVPDWDSEGPSLEGAVYQALGAVSVCWENMEGTGVFQSTEAVRISEGLLKYIRESSDCWQPIEDLTEAIRLTVEYAGGEILPAIEGWSWYDAMVKYAPEKAKLLKAYERSLRGTDGPA